MLVRGLGVYDVAKMLADTLGAIEKALCSVRSGGPRRGAGWIVELVPRELGCGLRRNFCCARRDDHRGLEWLRIQLSDIDLEGQRRIAGRNRVP
jgi:hypothetical protein